jgi:hypothetical protein
VAITTYATLVTAVENWIERDDLTDRIPEFIALAEGIANRKLDTRQMFTRSAAFTIDSVTETLPTGFAGVVSFKLNSAEPKPLFYRKPDDFDDLREAGFQSQGEPRFYTEIGETFVFSPTPDSAYTATLVYRTTLTALSESNASNWLLAAYPDVYLHGAMAFAHQYLEDAQMEAKFMAAFLAGISDINAAQNRRGAGSSPARRVRGFA